MTFSGPATNTVRVNAASGITFELDDVRLLDAVLFGGATAKLVAPGDPPSFVVLADLEVAVPGETSGSGSL